jgi:RNA polymerase sigma factor (sigma-70 family)
MHEVDAATFERLVASHRAELYAHCYRMLGSPQDAEDALQEALLGAWRGLSGFEGRSSLRAWLYRVASNACLRLIARRPRRVLSADPDRFRLGAINVLSVRAGRIAAITGFLDPQVHRRSGLPDEFRGDRVSQR